MCHTIPFCKNKQGTYTMHMISWEWMKKVSTPGFKCWSKQPGLTVSGGWCFGDPKLTLMDAFVAVTSVTQMAAQNTSHCGFDMFLTIVAANLSAWHLQKMETKAHRQLLPLFRATTVWPSKDSKKCKSFMIHDCSISVTLNQSLHICTYIYLFIYLLIYLFIHLFIYHY